MKVIWTVTPVGYQHIAKRCPSCSVKRDFTPSGAFRVNSQKKVLDVWSIYKCTHCDYTWNISLFSRLPASKINRDLYYRLMTNDATTVQHFAYDNAILKRNNAELSGRPDFKIQERWSVSIAAHRQVSVSVRISRSFQVSLLSILKKQLMLSVAEIRRRIETGQISGITMKMLKSRKLKNAKYDFQLSAETLYHRRRIMLIRR
ncbi:DUF1062 domain-containing protein [Salmonella enterica]|uniref:DUF1062 domain-containing protein n=1 Tax=Salmonella enterica subsp. VII serovar 40:z4,z24:[z39] TaxID=1967625 RepID=A0A731TJC8_SALEE|nr:DUF1062 domain-containing protein [Salmonella enterica]EDO5294719.1 DUF1062 domain-containing protein [Salmonella enterica subsp. houtenae serovar 40:z4,z24:-]EDS6438524.1 DUF1062 domain-containing protein [Salmonella enterica subsp. VII str. CFSAN000550]EDT6886880.1 DUF1062 domain-containing protein [Salmonella enterica subsp. enterica]EDU7899173.1 DUF1062 domain-containing protein [Salmonella enterica subsp. houtenae]QJY67067.1 DUF1062 domain-containing protein [Salmonella enterica subsp.